MRRIGYIRVSTQEQRPDRQIAGLQNICDELHVERLSAVSRKRPVFQGALDRLEHGDRLVLWDLDRAFRSTRDALDHIEALRARGVELEIATLSLDTSTPAGIFVYTMMSALAEFERRILAQRTREGLAAAKKRGKTLGRPPKIPRGDIGEIQARLDSGLATIADIADEYDIAPWSVVRSIRRNGFELKHKKQPCGGAFSSGRR